MTQSGSNSASVAELGTESCCSLASHWVLCLFNYITLYPRFNASKVLFPSFLIIQIHPSRFSGTQNESIQYTHIHTTFVINDPGFVKVGYIISYVVQILRSSSHETVHQWQNSFILNLARLPRQSYVEVQSH